MSLHSAAPIFKRGLSKHALYSAFLLIICFACDHRGTPYQFDLPPDFVPPPIPESNFLSKEKVKLGRFLFYDTALSINNKQSCASCHQQKYAFSEKRETSLGATGQLHHRNAPTLTNTAYNSTLTWAHPGLKKLEKQILIPLFNEDPVEMGLSGSDTLVIRRIKSRPLYPILFKKAYPSKNDPINIANIVMALASFVRTLVSFNSPFDRYAWHGDDTALTDAELRGLSLFMSEKLECRHCHGGFNFSLSSTHNPNSIQSDFHNTGLYYPSANIDYDRGIYEFTGNEKDMGKFRAPTLRNIEFTAPYMHDGSLKTLEQVIEFYAAGGRNIEEGQLAGDGRQHPGKSIFLHGFTINKQEKRDLIYFLKSLSDKHFISNEGFSNPYKSESARP